MPIHKEIIGAFGSSEKKTEVTTVDKLKGARSTSQLQVDEGGLLRLIENALSGASGLSQIFSNEAGSGLFNTSVSKQASGDLLSKIVGELAALTGTTVTSELQSEQTGTKKVNEASKSSFGENVVNEIIRSTNQVKDLGGNKGLGVILGVPGVSIGDDKPLVDTGEEDEESINEGRLSGDTSPQSVGNAGVV